MELVKKFSSSEPPIYSAADYRVSRQTTKFEGHQVPEPRVTDAPVHGHYELAALYPIFQMKDTMHKVNYQ